MTWRRLISQQLPNSFLDQTALRPTLIGRTPKLLT